ncbi:MAG: sensor histidine kinase [Yoonia sp.]|nr:sensor histidine kinase [Yoonia sp.]
MRILPKLVFFVLAALIVGAVFRLSYGYFLSQEITKSQGRLSLYHGTVTAELERFSHLTYVLARDPFVIQTAQGGNTEQLNSRLSDFAQAAGLDAIYLMRPDGVTVSASNAKTPTSFVGQDYGFRPYFQDAAKGRQGRFYGIGATTGLPGYFIADPVHDADAGLLGVIAIKIDLTELSDSWQSAGEQVFLSNKNGVVLLASNPAWRYRTLTDLSSEQRSFITATRQFPDQKLASLNWQPRASGRATIDGADRLHVTAADLPHGWQLHYFASNAAAATRSWLVTIGIVFAAGIALSIVQIQRARRMARALKRSEDEEIQLRQTNNRLAQEIQDRHTAERRLERTQAELDRASRLAALGQLSASVTHELGQPIAAMRNHIAAAEIGAAQSPSFMPKISGLVDRMEGITRQLKFFARSDSEPFETVDLMAAMQAALELVAPNIDAVGVKVIFAGLADPLIMRGNRLRLEQVLTNVLRNAIDAVEDTPMPEIGIRFGADQALVWAEIRDNGHGIGDATLAELQEPFVTTRESGRGMGLGLAISAGIVRDHGGEMTAQNGDPFGTVFRLTFPHSESDL